MSLVVVCKRDQDHKDKRKNVEDTDHEHRERKKSDVILSVEEVSYVFSESSGLFASFSHKLMLISVLDVRDVNYENNSCDNNGKYRVKQDKH